MSISGDLRRHMLSVTPDATIGAVLKDIRTRPQPETWVLLYPLGEGYAIISVQELARRWTTVERFLSRRLEELVATISPAIEDGIEGDAQALLGATGYVVVLRDGAPFGVLVRPGTRPPLSQVQLVLD